MLDMLAECAERFELDTAVRLWAPVYLLLVDSALQVLIEAGECPEREVAYEALVPRPIPRSVRRPRLRRRGFVPSRPADEPVGVRDNAVSVRPHDSAVHIIACHARRAGSRLEVEHEGRNGYKRLVAAASGARDGARTVLLGVQVLLEVVLIEKTPAARGAEVVHLVVVFFEFRVAVK